MQYFVSQDFQNYWLETGGIQSLGMFIADSLNSKFLTKLGLIMAQGRVEISSDVPGMNFTGICEEDKMLYYLIHLGYLSYQIEMGNTGGNERKTGYALIPNKEIQSHWNLDFPFLVKKFLGANADQIKYELEAAFDGFDIPQIQRIMSQLLMQATPQHSMTCVKDYYEFFYCFFLGILYGKKQFKVKLKSDHLGLSVTVPDELDPSVIIFEFDRADNVMHRREEPWSSSIESLDAPGSVLASISKRYLIRI
jgi:hypothetical protein